MPINFPPMVAACIDEDQIARIRNTHPGDSITITLADGSIFEFDVSEESMVEFNQFTTASCAGMIQVSLSTCQMVDIDTMAMGQIDRVYNEVKDEKRRVRNEKKLYRKRLKAEAKAQDLLKSMIGLEEWKTYRPTNRVILKPNKHFWIVGDYFGSYDKSKPFSGKPDVIRIDNQKKMHITTFCVDQFGGDDTPFTDKIIFFVTHLAADENLFVKTINRIGEKTLNSVKECAVWNA